MNDDNIIHNQTLPVNDESQDSEITIQRCPHDDANPYTMVKNDLIRDVSISPECRWMIIYLLSNKEGWKIKAQQLINHLKPHMGRNSVYKVLDEAIKAGYIKREDVKKTFNKKGAIHSGVKYFVSETPKFKESLRRPDLRDTDDRHPENGHIKNILSEKNEQVEEHATHTPPSSEVAIAPVDEAVSVKRKKASPEFSIKVREVANQMINTIVKHCPVYRPPADLTKFLYQVAQMIETDKQDPAVLLKAFEWGVADNEQRGDFNGWQGIICTNNKGGKVTTPAEIFRKHFSKIHSQMNSRPKRKFAAGTDLDAAMEGMAEMNKRAL